MRKMPEAVDTVRRLGANGKWEGYRTGQTGNELPSPHVRLRLIDDRVAQAPEGVKRQLVIPGGPLWVKNGSRGLSAGCLLHPRKRTLDGHSRRSVKGQKRTTATEPMIFSQSTSCPVR